MDVAGADREVSDIYQLKWIPWKGEFVPIVTQNENGPCPLLALCNVLLLKNVMTITPGLTVITSKELMDLLGSCLVNCRPKKLNDTYASNYEQNMQDAIAVFPCLLTGLDVNVKFNSVSGFEFTKELSIFDLLGVQLYHGWLADPSDSPTYTVVSQYTYNQLVELAINDLTSEDSVKVNSALLAEQFLQSTATQLTYHGLCELNRIIKEGELCVFFRNNHFNTLLKHKNQLLLLVTDYGFLNELGHVWHVLNDIDDSGDFLDTNFQFATTLQSSSQVPEYDCLPTNHDTDIDIAIGLQAEENFVTTQGHIPTELAITDEELAMRLQQEELQQIPQVQSETVIPAPRTTEEYQVIAHEVIEERNRRRRSSGCCIL